MKKKNIVLALIALCLIISSSCSSLKSTRIRYEFPPEINAALKEGTDKLEKLYGNDFNNLKFFAVIFGDIETNIVINTQYSQPDQIKNLIRSTNRFVFLGRREKLPVIFLSDIHSTLFKEWKLKLIPYGGYIVSLDSENKVKHTGFLL
ncbi:MAG: hypothetical protein R3D00_08795 [Bacteroidia bacterium]